MRKATEILESPAARRRLTALNESNVAQPTVATAEAPLPVVTCKWGSIIPADVDSYNRYLNVYTPRKVEEPEPTETQRTIPVLSSAAVPHLKQFAEWLPNHDSFAQTKKVVSERLAARLATRVKPQIDEMPIPIPEGHVRCTGTVAFKCSIGHHENRKCSNSSFHWNAVLQALTHHSFHLKRKRPSLQTLVEKLDWQVSPFVGCAEILALRKFSRLVPYAMNDGSRCARCERRLPILEKVKDSCCRNCIRMTAARSVAQRNADEYPIKDDVAPRGPKTLVFLCARTSTDSEKLNEELFEKLLQSVRLSERLPGRFGYNNRPGYPQGIKVVGKFASAANALCPISAMTTPAKGQSADVFTLNLLPDFIINAYRPGDTVLIVVSQPTSLCTGHQDLELFIRQLFERGIPKSVLFLYCHGLRSKHGMTETYVTNILASDLRDAILNHMPRYGIRPYVSAYLFANENDSDTDD